MWQAWVYKVATDFSLVQFSGKRFQKAYGQTTGLVLPLSGSYVSIVIRELVVDAVEDFAKARLVRDGVAHLFQIVLVG